MMKPHISMIPDLHRQNPVVSLVFEQEQMLSNRISSGNSSGTKTRINTHVSDKSIQKIKSPFDDLKKTIFENNKPE
ncbi:MAG: hypothetical protein K9H16_15895 [Bacteroidales bacterium]|nr:hypothetical protein [Bacteroidales bacterium]